MDRVNDRIALVFIINKFALIFWANMFSLPR